jgi:hypothetical protein
MNFDDPQHLVPLLYPARSLYPTRSLYPAWSLKGNLEVCRLQR